MIAGTAEEVVERMIARAEKAGAEIDRLEKELAPCPFCGLAGSLYFDYPKMDCVVKCDNCGCHGPKCDTPQSASTNWNTRP